MNPNKKTTHTVDGRNPAPVDTVGQVVYPIIYLQGFIHPNGGCLGFLNHQQYVEHLSCEFFESFIGQRLGGWESLASFHPASRSANPESKGISFRCTEIDGLYSSGYSGNFFLSFLSNMAIFVPNVEGFLPGNGMHDVSQFCPSLRFPV